MSAEPPVGDDMERMLAGMRRNVAERLDDRPGRRTAGRRAAVIAAVVAVLAVGTAGSAVALGMIPQPFVAAPGPSSSPSAPAPTRSPSAEPFRPTRTPTPDPSAPAPTPTAEATAAVPTSCAEAVPPGDAQRLFGSQVLHQIRPAVAGGWQDSYTDPDVPFTADASLVCHWDPYGSTESATNLHLSMGTADRGVLLARLGVLEEQGQTCADTLGGRSCQSTETATYSSEPVETTFTFFVRDDTWITVEQTDTPTDGLLDALVQQTWG